MKRFSIISLGCHKNLVDSEYICEKLVEKGYILVPDDKDADFVVVNTCAFLRSAVEESIETMLELVQDGKDVMCAGCLVSRYGKELLDELPEIRFFIGQGNYASFPEYIENDHRYVPPRFGGVVQRSFFSTGASAYVKLSEGCSNSCNYCLIPSIRGNLVSKGPSTVIEECSVLASKGVRELILIAQDLGSYGQDRRIDIDLTGLIDRISAIGGIEWVRIMYMHPGSLTGPVVDQLVGNPKVCPYIDMPVQHISEKVLHAMGRKGGLDAVKKAFDMLSKSTDKIWIRSTIMVGHPYEDEHAFRELENFVGQGYIDHLGVFAYSPEQGTRSCSMENQVEDDIKMHRKNRIMELQQEISRRRMQGLVGRSIDVLVEGFHPETELLLKARASFQAPDVDGMVIINEGTADFGAIQKVEIVKAQDYDLIGKMV